MSSNWFYSANGQQHGPVSAATLKQLADSGQLGPDDLVCQEDSEQWVAASRLKGLFSPASPPVPPASQPPIVDPLAQIQINVGNAVKGIGSAVKNVAESEQVKAAGVKIKNAAGQAAEGVGNFIRSDAVQTQVTAAKGSWAKLTTQHKLLAAGIGSLGLLMMSCCMCGGLGMMFGRPNPSMTGTIERERSSSPSNGAQSAYGGAHSDQPPTGWNPVNEDVWNEIDHRKPIPDIAADIMWKKWDEYEELDNGFLHYTWRNGNAELILIYDSSGHFRQAVANTGLKHLPSSHKSKWKAHLEYLAVNTDPLKVAYQSGHFEGCRAGEQIVRKIKDQSGKIARDHLIKVYNENAVAREESRKQAFLDSLKRGAQNSESIQKAIGTADGLRDTLSKAGFLR